MTDKRNSTDDTDADDFEAAFKLALHDALKSTDKPTAALLEVCRKAVEDARAHRRWMTEQRQLAGASAAAAAGPSDSEDEPSETHAPYVPPVPPGFDVSKLPFPVARKGVQKPPVKTETTADADKRTAWDALDGTVPFLAPQ
jgi:hypothetical protein